MKKLLFSALMLLLTGVAFANDDDAQQTVSIGDATIEKVVSKITFAGDEVVLTFSDNTTQQADMELVRIAFSYNATAISAPRSAAAANEQRVYTLQGQYLGSTTSGLQRGIYVINGKKFVIK